MTKARTIPSRFYPAWLQPTGFRLRVAHAWLPAADAGCLSLCERHQIGEHGDNALGDKEHQPDLEDTYGCCSICIQRATKLGLLTLHGVPVRRVPGTRWPHNVEDFITLQRWACVCCREVQTALPNDVPRERCACLLGTCGIDRLSRRMDLVQGGKPHHGGQWIHEDAGIEGCLRYQISMPQLEALFNPSPKSPKEKRHATV